MAIALLSFAEGSRIRTGVDTDLQEQVKHAVEGVDTMLADPNVLDQLAAFEKALTANPELQCCLESTMKAPSLQKQMASVQKQMDAMKVESPSLLEVSESSDGGAKVKPWKAMAATLLLTSNLSPSVAFDVARVKQAMVKNAPASSKAQLSKVVESATPLIAAAVLTAGALPAVAGDAGAGEGIFSAPLGCTAAPHCLMIVDSGTTLLYLPEAIVEVLEGHVAESVDLIQGFFAWGACV